MGGAVGVVLPPERIETLRRASHAAVQHGRVAAVHVGLVRVVRVAERLYAVVDQRVISRVHRVVEKQVVRRINLLADHIEVASKLWFVKSISTTSIAEAFDIDTKECVHCKNSAQTDEGLVRANCCAPLQCPEGASEQAQLRGLQLRAGVAGRAVLEQSCPGARAAGSGSDRFPAEKVPVDSVATAYFLAREGGPIVRLRLGRKWVGAHHLSEDMAHPMKSQWLHRVDYEVGEQVHTDESEFFQTVKAAWEDYLVELAKLPKEDDNANDVGEPFPYDEQEKRTSLRIKYLLDTSLENILNDRRTMFRMPHQYELWRMEQEDAPEHRQDCLEDRMVGPLLHGPIDELIALYEEKGMTAEDVDVQWS
ncbi:unnamed protein product [Phytophthora lilii]|uniref:Unnamed protein product n=1 Tax=Phytophthora lilii TaxID=2077276 RepID=A0A9W6YJG9_9STRA|nr:unnamed protein product [Phytophthora lilii]